MIVPVRLALLLALFVGAAARAEAAQSRTKRDRPVAVTVSPAAPLPELHIAPDVPTLLLFPSDIQRKTITVDPSRIRVVDTGARSIIVQAVEDYRPGERQELEVFFEDGRAPARAAFVLVMDPAEVDTRIDVARPALPNGACPAEAPRTPRPEDFVLMGYVDPTGVSTAAFGRATDVAQGLTSDEGFSYRGKGWVLIDVVITNLPGRPPWTPREATLTSKEGAPLRARLVAARKGEFGPAEEVRVLAVVDTPPPSAGLVFTVAVLGEDGRSIAIQDVKIPAPAKEPKP